jgi:DNA-binding protein WhiA
VVTWKSADRVVRFLRSAGAGSALLDLEARSVTRVLRSDLNRLSNADAANAARSVLAAARQIASIRLLTRSGCLDREREVVRFVAAARLASPDATLDDLAETCGYTRSTAQRALERIGRLARGAAAVDR